MDWTWRVKRKEGYPTTFYATGWMDLGFGVLRVSAELKKIVAPLHRWELQSNISLGTERGRQSWFYTRLPFENSTINVRGEEHAVREAQAQLETAVGDMASLILEEVRN